MSPPSRGTAPSATTMIGEYLVSNRVRTRSQTSSMSNGTSGIRTTLAPPAIPAWSAIHPACRPISSTTSARWCDSAVVCSRSMASMAMLTAVSKPKVKSVPERSLSIVLDLLDTALDRERVRPARAQDGASAREDAAHLRDAEVHGLSLERALPAVAIPDELEPVHAYALAHHSPDHRV